MRLSGALQKKRTSEISYREIIKNSSNDDTTTAKQVNSILSTCVNKRNPIAVILPNIVLLKEMLGNTGKKAT